MVTRFCVSWAVYMQLKHTMFRLRLVVMRNKHQFKKRK
ncbi:hypothetical protein BSPLISOX_3158 [uncultured Gammaproteobacteria bacterium]|nr:hypothetical protein [uncultured Gammaproteobacteria bacterium]VVH66860.1 hypothetical protein BSPLISOX_3158 [uncultured Gammaproteobacteria bacterium]